MFNLVFVTCLWAFSFSLIGVYLAGMVDPWVSAGSRIFLALCVLLPFLKFRAVPKTTALQLMGIGAVQLGVMYGFYYHAFLYLTVPEVLLFTVMTPIYITLLNDAWAKQLHVKTLGYALLAVLGGVAIRFDGITSDFLLGLCLVQGANLCFAFGQVAYTKVMAHQKVAHHQVFGFFFIGASIVALVCIGLFADFSRLPHTPTQWGVLVYLGIVASGLGYLLWNKGATQVSVGTLAVMNNALIPLGILVNIVIWQRDADIVKLSIGGGIILLALLLSQNQDKGKKPPAHPHTDPR